MKLLPSLLRPLAAVLLLACTATPLLAQQAGPDPRTAPTMPDPKLTPGNTLPVTLADLQVKGYSGKVRNVPISVKREVYASYGTAHWNPGEYEVDHLKDHLEDKLLALVRAGKVDLHTAQQEMATDWITAYKKYVSPSRSPPRRARPAPTSPTPRQAPAPRTRR